MADSIQVWSNPMPGSVSTDLELIFNSLTQWLTAPTFLNGVTVGNGDGTQTGDGAGVATNLVNANSITQAPLDTSAPNTPSITTVGGVRSVLAYWPAVVTANGSPVANYVAQISTSNLFGTLAQTLNPVGPVAGFDNLTPNTTYFVRVAAVSYAGNQGPWSTTSTVATPQISTTDIAANTITAASAILASASVVNANIASITADKITAGTINAQTIQLGATGGTAALQSTNYVTGSAGWAIKGDGTAEFGSVNIYGGLLRVGPAAGAQVTVEQAGGSGEILFSYNGVAQSSITANAVGITLFQGTNGSTDPQVILAPNGAVGSPYLQLNGPAATSGPQLGSNASAILDSLGQVQIHGAAAGTQVLLDDNGNIKLSVAGNITLAGSGGAYQAVGTLTPTVGGRVPVIQTVSATHLTDASGFIAVVWPTAFPNSITSVVAQMDDTLARYAVVSAVSTTGCNLRVVNGATSPDSALASTSVTYHIIAVGT